MIEEIGIKNLGIISEAKLEFTEGLTVLTGETGAGKTMVLSALHLLLGKRGNSGMVQEGSESLSVEGCWNMTNDSLKTEIEDTGAEIDEDGQLYINRTVKANGKSRAVVGGKTVPAKTLERIGSQLVNIHGQSEQLRLKNPEAQLEALDNYSGKTVSTAHAKYLQKFQQWNNQAKMIADIKENSTKKKREIAVIKKFVEDFDRIAPQVDEDLELSETIQKLSNIDDLREYLSEAYVSLTTDEMPQISETLRTVQKSLEKASRISPELEELVDKTEQLYDLFYDVETSIEKSLNSLDEDSIQQLHEAQARELDIKQLVRKNGSSLNEIINQREASEAELAELEKYLQPIDELEDVLDNLEQEMLEAAGKLSESRRKFAEKLEKAVNKELVGLSMSGSVLKIVCSETKPSTSGMDEVMFGLQMKGSGNVNPITKGASGGELSRIMLALEVVLADTRNTATFVFDEVDSGVGGETAIEIGKRLSRLSKDAQVIVVTHLPQVAAYADNHLKVSKTEFSDNIETTVEKLSKPQRISELTRMLSGLSDSESGRSHAKDLLEHAEKFKN